MAGTNRNPKLWLREAWKHYWSALFRGGVDWQTGLENEIRKRLYFPGETSGFQVGEESELEPPSWANDLDIGFQDNFVAIKFKSTGFGRIPLFADQLLPVLGNWKNNNPLERAGGQSGLTPRDRDECRELFISAVRECGNTIRNRLLHVLKETEQPKFEIHCRPRRDVFAEEKKLPAMGLFDVVGIGIVNNELTGNLRLPKYSYVQIKQRTPSTSKVGPHGSFHELDAALVENMKTLIDQGKARSVLQAAKMVLATAARRPGASDDSVVRRLQDRFFQKYHNYINRQGQPLAPQASALLGQ